MKAIADFNKERRGKYASFYLAAEPAASTGIKSIMDVRAHHRYVFGPIFFTYFVLSKEDKKQETACLTL